MKDNPSGGVGNLDSYFCFEYITVSIFAVSVINIHLCCKCNW